MGKSWRHFYQDLELDEGAHSLLLFNIVLEILPRAIRQEENQKDTNWKGK